LPVNKLLDAGVAPQEIPLPHELLFNQELMGQLYPSFKKGLLPFFTLNWSEYSDFLTFKGGLNPVTGSLWLSDTAHHHLALAVLFIFAGHMYRTNWGIGHSMKEILEAHKGPLTGEGHKGLYEILTTSWHAQLAINLAMMGSLSIIVSHHMYAMPPYPYIGIDYPTQLSLFTHHMWIGGFCVVGAGAHASIFMVRDYSPVQSYNNLLDRVLRHRDAIISHLNWVCIFLGTHSFGLYIHNDTMRASSITPPRLGMVIDSENYQLSISGAPGEIYHVEFSSDLAEWSGLAKVVIPENGSINIELGSSIDNRYFRAVYRE
jgi:photosystem I P700 chlorophyll a apoprotein A1